ncbi:MAG: TonB-dependent receptor plug domain-containing protein [Ignavibacteriae bacterium]|nr:TonB-dependent receptor plug domain-containing protein [Ignavibacteriota bacterium]
MNRAFSIGIITLALAVLIQSGVLLSQVHSSPDGVEAPDSLLGTPFTVKSYMFDEVVVTGTRTPVSKTLSASRIFTLSDKAIRAENADNLGEILVGRPGLVVRQYGGGGDLQIVSFRGMGAEHTAVLLDGLPIGNVQTGLTDLRLIPLDHVQSVELLRGGSSATYGSDAVGGVVNILTHTVAAGSFARVEASAGSFGARRFSLSAQAASTREFGVMAGSSTEYGRGNYAFAIDEGGKELQGVRTNSDYHARHLFFKARWEPSERTRSTALLTSYRIDRGTPGPVLIVANQGIARQTDHQLMAAASYQTSFTEDLLWTFAGNFQNSYERYVNSSIAFPADNFYRNILMTLVSDVRYGFTPSVFFHSGVEWGNTWASGNALAARKTRPHVGLFVSSELHAGVSNLTASFYPLFRYDSFGSIGNAVSPKLGMNIRLGRQSAGPVRNLGLTLHSTVGKDFRVPTLNQLYYAGAGGRGNLNLQPERSTSFDAGLSVDWALFGGHEIDFTYYSISTENRILWLPTSSPFIWSPVNFGRTLSTGFEVEFRWSPLADYVSIEGNYAFLDAKKKSRTSPDDPTFNKQLIYVPLETGSIGVKARVPVRDGLVSEVFLWISDSFTGERFVVEDNSVSLPGYHLVAGNCGVEFRLLETSVRVKYEVANLFDEPYEVIPRFPMPLRSDGVSVSIHKSF